MATPRLEDAMLSTLPALLPGLAVGKVRRLPGSRREAPQAQVEVQAPGGQRRLLHFTFREAAAPSRIRGVLPPPRPAGRRPSYPVLATRFLSPRARAVCRQAGMGYLDLAGNCWLQFDGVYVDKAVAENPFPALGRPTSVFTPVASRVLRALLEEPQRAWTFVTLAQAAGVSLGQAHKVVQQLRHEAYLEAQTRHIRLVAPGPLLDAWAAAYAQQPVIPAAYYALQRDPAQLMAQVAALAAERHWRCAFTSLAAAQVVAPFVRGVSTVAWHADPRIPVTQWVEALELRPVEAGPNVLIYPAYDDGVFYRMQPTTPGPLVGLIQLYLDLWREPGRGQEQAAFLRQQRIGF